MLTAARRGDTDVVNELGDTIDGLGDVQYAQDGGAAWANAVQRADDRNRPYVSTRRA